jgi:probable FeS assembly SUF system protein SufT
MPPDVMSTEPGGYIQLKRDVEAIRIPSGEHITLPAETIVIITQALGGTFTVVVANQAGLYRIKGEDADALGREKIVSEQKADGPFDESKIWEQLRNCYDPEIPVNIVDLGLIYGLAVTDVDGGKHVEVKMTLTALGCGMGPAIAGDAQQRILTVPGVESANVELVWDPPWNPDRISEAGRQKLGMV